MSQKTKFILGPGRLSFPHIFKPNEEGFGGKYSATILLPPGYDFVPLKGAMMAVATATFGPDKAKWPRGMRGPKDIIRPAEEKGHLTGYEAGWSFLTASSADMPGIVDAALGKVNDPREAYAGRWINLSVNVFAYSNVKHGVSLGLQNVQLLRHDDAFSSRARAEDEFEQMHEDMQDADTYQRSAGGGDDFGDDKSSGSSGGGWDD